MTMEIFYSPSARGFFTAALHGAAVPPDAIGLSIEEHATLLAGQAAGREIVPGEDGRPVLAYPPPAPPVRVISPLAFRRRLGAARRAEITLAASQAMQGGDATLQTWLDDLAASRVVDLDDAELRAGVAALLGAGLITEAERDTLLADGQPTERA